MSPTGKLRTALCFLAIAVSSPASQPKPSNCPAQVAAYQEDLEPPFVGHWRRDADLLSAVKAFDRILMLADGQSLRDSLKIASHYPDKFVVGTDIQISRTFFSSPSNLLILEMDVRQPFPYEDGSFDLVYMKSGLCHCYKDTQACCGIESTEPAITHFFTEILRVLDKRKPHSLAFLHGCMPPSLFSQWLQICQGVASQNGFACIPQVQPRDQNRWALWGFKIRRLRASTAP